MADLPAMPSLGVYSLPPPRQPSEPTVASLGQLVKKKYPGAYDQFDDAQLGRMVKSKYPGQGYDHFADPMEMAKGHATGQSPAELQSHVTDAPPQYGAAIGPRGQDTYVPAEHPARAFIGNLVPYADSMAALGTGRPVREEQMLGRMADEANPKAAVAGSLTQGAVAAATPYPALLTGALAAASAHGKGAKGTDALKEGLQAALLAKGGEKAIGELFPGLSAGRAGEPNATLSGMAEREAVRATGADPYELQALQSRFGSTEAAGRRALDMQMPTRPDASLATPAPPSTEPVFPAIAHPDTIKQNLSRVTDTQGKTIGDILDRAGNVDLAQVEQELNDLVRKTDSLGGRVVDKNSTLNRLRQLRDDFLAEKNAQPVVEGIGQRARSASAGEPPPTKTTLYPEEAPQPPVDIDPASQAASMQAREEGVRLPVEPYPQQRPWFESPTTSRPGTLPGEELPPSDIQGRGSYVHTGDAAHGAENGTLRPEPGNDYYPILRERNMTAREANQFKQWLYDKAYSTGRSRYANESGRIQEAVNADPELRMWNDVGHIFGRAERGAVQTNLPDELGKFQQAMDQFSTAKAFQPSADMASQKWMLGESLSGHPFSVRRRVMDAFGRRPLARSLDKAAGALGGSSESAGLPRASYALERALMPYYDGRKHPWEE